MKKVVAAPALMPIPMYDRNGMSSHVCAPPLASVVAQPNDSADDLVAAALSRSLNQVGREGAGYSVISGLLANHTPPCSAQNSRIAGLVS